MILVADSGSTKTDWRLIVNHRVTKKISTVGINPYFHNSQSVKKVLLESDFGNLDKTKVTHIYFYGAGCSSVSLKKIMQEGFRNVFLNAKILIEHDMLGAARALFGNEKGLALILGTGSNTCLYNGENIIKHRGGLGYILGDEGSGMYKGRELIKSFMNDIMPEDLLSKFIDKYNLSKSDIVQKVYKEPMPNRFLATFCKFISENINHSFCEKIVRLSFREFISLTIENYENYAQHKIRVVGSVGYYYSDLLIDEIEKKGMQIDGFIKQPVDSLADYHISELN